MAAAYNMHKNIWSELCCRCSQKLSWAICILPTRGVHISNKTAWYTLQVTRNLSPPWHMRRRKKGIIITTKKGEIYHGLRPVLVVRCRACWRMISGFRSLIFNIFRSCWYWFVGKWSGPAFIRKRLNVIMHKHIFCELSQKSVSLM
jgi:hypothetical protein